MIDRATEVALIAALRDAAQAEILPRFRNLGAGDIDTKTGPEDLVTVADRAAEAMLARAVATVLPGADFVGEEAVSDDPDILTRLARPGLTVIVDPIDGTSNFAHGNATFGMILAVADGNRTLLGVLYDPILDDWIVARRGGGCWFHRAGVERRTQTRAPRPIATTTGYLPLYHFAKRQQPALAALFPRVGRMHSLRCSCHEYRMLVTGQADFAISPKSHPWDHAAGQLAVLEAGGTGGNLTGGDYDLRESNAMLIAATGMDTRTTMAGLVLSALSGDGGGPVPGKTV